MPADGRKQGEVASAELLRRIRCGDRAAGEALLRLHRGLIGRVVGEFARQRGSLEMADLEQEARLGLWRAAQAFDPARGVQFSTYAMTAMRRALMAALETQRDLIRRPPWIHRHAGRVRAAQSRLTRRLGREPTLEEAALEAGLPLSVVREVAELAHGLLSLDARVCDEEETTLGEVLPAPEEAQGDLLFREWIAWLRSHPDLDARERALLAVHYGFDGHPLTLAASGAALGMARETTGLVRARALKKLRGIVAGEV